MVLPVLYGYCEDLSQNLEYSKYLIMTLSNICPYDEMFWEDFINRFFGND